MLPQDRGARQMFSMGVTRYCSEAVRDYRTCLPGWVSDLIKCDACAWNVWERKKARSRETSVEGRELKVW